MTSDSESVYAATIPDTYKPLFDILQEAFDQASKGKGVERHAAAGEAFVDQQIVKFNLWAGNIGFNAGQIAKKAMEAGYTNVAVMPDGIMGWKKAGQPTSKPNS